MKPLRAIATTAAVLALTAASAAVPAVAAADHTPPTVNLEPYARSLVGSQAFTAYYDPDNDPGFFDYWQQDMFLQWTASDPSGICSQAVTWQSYEFQGSEEDPVLGSAVDTFSVAASARKFTVSAINKANRDRIEDRFVVRVTDCAGNTATSDIAATKFGVREDDDPGLAYQGAWKTSRFSGFSGGTTHSTTAKGASVSLTFAGTGPIALVMEKAADRGKADVFVDGVKKATVDTHSATTKHRIVVWQGLYTKGSHTLKVVNKATVGHPRIDLDFIETCSQAIDQGSCDG
jgi:hypothetical protein